MRKRAHTWVGGEREEKEEVRVAGGGPAGGGGRGGFSLRFSKKKKRMEEWIDRRRPLFFGGKLDSMAGDWTLYVRPKERRTGLNRTPKDQSSLQEGGGGGALDTFPEKGGPRLKGAFLKKLLGAGLMPGRGKLLYMRESSASTVKAGERGRKNQNYLLCTRGKKGKEKKKKATGLTVSYEFLRLGILSLPGSGGRRGWPPRKTFT